MATQSFVYLEDKDRTSLYSIYYKSKEVLDKLVAKCKIRLQSYACGYLFLKNIL